MMGFDDVAAMVDDEVRQIRVDVNVIRVRKCGLPALSFVGVPTIHHGCELHACDACLRRAT